MGGDTLLGIVYFSPDGSRPHVILIELRFLFFEVIYALVEYFFTEVMHNVTGRVTLELN